MSVWESLHVSPEIIQALEKAEFTVPTPIQEKVLPCAIKESADVLGAAPTGSGKTLAFGIPLIMRVLEFKRLEAPNTPVQEIVDDEDVPMFESNQSKDLVAQNAEHVEPLTPKCKSKKKSKKRTDIYTFLDVIEELDADTGEVRAVHSLSGCQLPKNTSTDDDDDDDDKYQKIAKSASKKKSRESDVQMKDRIYGLVLLPTRELAVQVSKHLKMLAEFCEPQIRIETILGGMSVQKQTRILRSCPDIVVATPGRLWHFIQDDEPYISTLRHANVLVVDEADKLVEANHFEDLRALFNWLRSESPTAQEASETEPEVLPDTPKPDTKPNRKRRRKNTSNLPFCLARQTLVFSATLTFVHQGAMKPGSGAKQRKKFMKPKGTMTTKVKLGMLRELLGLRPNARVIDLTVTPNTTQPPKPQQDNVSLETKSAQSTIEGSLCNPDGLQEYRLLCPDQASKDIRLFWFLSFGRHEFGSSLSSDNASNQRCLIFLNSKAGVRRLAGVVKQLMNSLAFRVSQFPCPQHVNVLHAGMAQKQRLRALEHFQADPVGILLASDVAARGLDLATTMDECGSGGVPWVVHFEVPHTAELYIHRRGRTARAHRSGISLLFICPNEARNWHRLAVSLRRSELDLDDFTIQPSDRHLSVCDCIVSLARQLDLLEHSSSRDNANESWFKRAAKEADILLDDDSNGDDDDEGFMSGGKSKKARLDSKHDQQVRSLRFQITQLIDKSRSDLLKQRNKDSGIVKSNLHSWTKKKLLKKVKV